MQILSVVFAFHLRLRIALAMEEFEESLGHRNIVEPASLLLVIDLVSHAQQ